MEESEDEEADAVEESNIAPMDDRWMTDENDRRMRTREGKGTKIS